MSLFSTWNSPQQNNEFILKTRSTPRAQTSAEPTLRNMKQSHQAWNSLTSSQGPSKIKNKIKNTGSTTSLSSKQLFPLSFPIYPENFKICQHFSVIPLTWPHNSCIQICNTASNQLFFVSFLSNHSLNHFWLINCSLYNFNCSLYHFNCSLNHFNCSLYHFNCSLYHFCPVQKIFMKSINPFLDVVPHKKKQTNQHKPT